MPRHLTPPPRRLWRTTTAWRTAHPTYCRLRSLRGGRDHRHPVRAQRRRSLHLTSAPNYTEAGNYTVYYKITYTYADTDMVEDGVAYVHLTATADGSCGCGCGDPDCDCQDPDCDGDCCNQDCEHHFVCHDTVAPTCMALGYDRLMYRVRQDGQGQLQGFPGPRLSSVVVREATCETPGKTMDICGERCGNVKESTIRRRT